MLAVTDWQSRFLSMSQDSSKTKIGELAPPDAADDDAGAVFD